MICCKLWLFKMLNAAGNVKLQLYSNRTRHTNSTFVLMEIILLSKYDLRYGTVLQTSVTLFRFFGFSTRRYYSPNQIGVKGVYSMYTWILYILCWLNMLFFVQLGKLLKNILHRKADPSSE